jgi:hypothetical protein
VNNLKLSKFGVITLLLFGMVIALTGIVCADRVVPAVPETQSLVTGTTADVVGLAMETDAGAWTLTNGENLDVFSGGAHDIMSLEPNDPNIKQLIAGGGSVTWDSPGSAFFTQMVIPQSMLNTPVADPGFFGFTNWQSVETLLLNYYTKNVLAGGIHTGALNPNQVQYTTAYDADIVAQAGHTVLTKSMNLHTGNKVIGQSNLNAQTGLTFAATDNGGNVVGSENLMLDGAAMPTTAADKMLCPFASAGGNVIPAYCNIVQVGSKYDLTIGSVTTNANERFVGTDATTPVAVNYAINVKPYTASGTQVPASGSTMAYIKAHIQEGNNFNTARAEDLTYSETSSANGYINSFSKVIAYQSGKSLL